MLGLVAGTRASGNLQVVADPDLRNISIKIPDGEDKGAHVRLRHATGAALQYSVHVQFAVLGAEGGIE